MEKTNSKEKLSVYIDGEKIVIYRHNWWGFNIIKQYLYSKENIIKAINYFLKEQRKKNDNIKEKIL